MSFRPPRTKIALEELPEFVGRELGVSEWRAIDQQSIDAFAQITGDEQWIHVDQELAASGPFGSTVAHGYLTLSLCSLFLKEILEVQGAALAVNYGLDRVRFPGPVPVDSSLRGSARLVSAQATPDGLQALLRVTVERHDLASEKPVCVADVIVRFYR